MKKGEINGIYERVSGARCIVPIPSWRSAEDLPLEAAALNNLSAREIFDLIVQLPVGYRTVFNLYEIEGMDHKEIAGLLGIAEGTSKSQLSKAKLLLQKNLLQNGTGYVKRKSR